jgi:peptidoglycan hydrolase-like protein with peptidoglycan-binding domain
VIAVAQYLLRAQGYPLTPNSTFDAATVAAIQDWQARQGLAVSSDGTITEQTWQSLATPLDGRSQGDPVSGLQTIMLRKGYPVTVTGGYDQDTRKAIQQMQVLHNLPPTGRVDTDTWCAVVGGVVRAEFTGVCR